MARRRLPPGQRKELREARLMVLLGLAFVTVCLVLMSQGDAGAMVLLGLFFGLAVLLVGAVQWWSIRSGPNQENEERASKIFVLTLLAASVLLGLASLGVFVLALVAWDEFAVSTTTLFPRPVAVVAGAAGAVLFIGGPIALLIRKGRPFGTKEHDDDGSQDPDDNG